MDTPELTLRKQSAGHYLVCEADGSATPYSIYKNKYGGWDLVDDAQTLQFNKRRRKDVLAAAQARWPHDKAWRKYEKAQAEWQERKKERDGFCGYAPTPDRHKLETPLGLGLDAEIVACRLGRNNEYPAFSVILDGTEVGKLVLFGTDWSVDGSTHYYAGENHDWTPIRHGLSDRDAKKTARSLINTAIRATIRRYLGTEIRRRDKVVEETLNRE